MSKAKSAIESQLKMLKRALEFMNRVRGRIRVLEVYVVAQGLEAITGMTAT